MFYKFPHKENLFYSTLMALSTNVEVQPTVYNSPFPSFVWRGGTFLNM